MSALGKLRDSAAGRGSGMFGVLEEIYAPTHHEAHLERDRQAAMSAPSPESPDLDGHSEAESAARYSGRITIEVDDS